MEKPPSVVSAALTLYLFLARSSEIRPLSDSIPETVRVEFLDNLSIMAGLNEAGSSLRRVFHFGGNLSRVQAMMLTTRRHRMETNHHVLYMRSRPSQSIISVHRSPYARK